MNVTKMEASTTTGFDYGPGSTVAITGGRRLRGRTGTVHKTSDKSVWISFEDGQSLKFTVDQFRFLSVVINKENGPPDDYQTEPRQPSSYPMISTSAFRKVAQEVFDLSGQDVGHIVASANGGADHPHNYTMQNQGMNRSAGKGSDCLWFYWVGLTQAKLAIRASWHQRNYQGPTALQLYKRGAMVFELLNQLHQDPEVLEESLLHELDSVLETEFLSCLRDIGNWNLTAKTGRLPLTDELETQVEHYLFAGIAAQQGRSGLRAAFFLGAMRRLKGATRSCILEWFQANKFERV